MLKLSCSLIFTIVSPYLACKLSPLYKWQTQVLSGGSKTCVTSISSKTHGGFPIVSQKKTPYVSVGKGASLIRRNGILLSVTTTEEPTTQNLLDNYLC